MPHFLLDQAKFVGYNHVVIMEPIRARGKMGGRVASPMCNDEAGRQIVSMAS
jgi:hypothetical protein